MVHMHLETHDNFADGHHPLAMDLENRIREFAFYNEKRRGLRSLLRFLRKSIHPGQTAEAAPI
jgi:hypothetical protein